jgi:ABC-2 type transport system permease protein
MNATASPMTNAIRIGVRRGWTEFVHGVTRVEEVMFSMITAGVILVVLWFQRDNSVDGSPFSLATLALPGVVGMLVALNATTGGSFVTAFEREDGTLLRVRAAPYGTVAYVVGQVVRFPLNIAISVGYVLVPGLFLFDGLAETGLDGWLTFLWVFVLGLLATLPIAVGLGAMSSNPRAVTQWLWFGGAGVIAVSGIFYPFSSLPGWLQSVGQVFPYYWLGLGMRSALLPEEAAAIEIDGSWRHLETAAVLGVWAVLGLVLAPLMLRRMARRVSGASVHAAREKAAQRLG